MAEDHYAALIEAWNSEVQPPPPAEGTGITPEMTTEEKLDCVNGWVVVGETPTAFYRTGNELANCVDWDEFNALKKDVQEDVLRLCGIPGPLVFGSEYSLRMPTGMFSEHFLRDGPTMKAFNAMALATPQPWWEYAGYGGPMSMTDVELAGLS